MKPCKRGHLSERDARGACIQCARERARQWFIDYPDRVRKRAAQWYVDNLDRAKERQKKYHEVNREVRIVAMRAYSKEYYKRCAENMRAKRQANRLVVNSRRQANDARRRAEINRLNAASKKRNMATVIACNAARRALAYKAEGRFGKKDVERLLINQSGICNICNGQLTKYHVDHVVPLARGGSNWPANLQLLCPPCNIRKGVLLI